MTDLKPTVRVIVVEHDGHRKRLEGRVGWALAALIDAGDQGVTPITVPAPRWSSYVHRLKRRHGFIIETVHEKHGPPFEGSHARYKLRSPVTVIEREAA